MAEERKRNNATGAGSKSTGASTSRNYTGNRSGSGRSSSGTSGRTLTQNGAGTSGRTSSGKTAGASGRTSSGTATTGRVSAGTRTGSSAGNRAGASKSTVNASENGRSTRTARTNSEYEKSSTAGKNRNAGTGSGRSLNGGRSMRSMGERDRESSYDEYDDVNSRSNETMTDEIVLIVSALLCILMILSYFGVCGPVGTGVNTVVFGLFGALGYVLPILILALTLFFVANNGRFFSTSKIICSAVFLMVTAALIQMIGYGYNPELGIGDYFTNSLLDYDGIFPACGGFFGGIVVKLLCSLFGSAGAVIIMIAVELIMLVVITGKAFILYLSHKFSETGKNWREERRLRRMEQDIYDNIEDGDYYDDSDYNDDRFENDEADNQSSRVRPRMGSISVSAGQPVGMHSDTSVAENYAEDTVSDDVKKASEQFVASLKNESGASVKAGRKNAKNQQYGSADTSSAMGYHAPGEKGQSAGNSELNGKGYAVGTASCGTNGSAENGGRGYAEETGTDVTNGYANGNAENGGRGYTEGPISGGINGYAANTANAGTVGGQNYTGTSEEIFMKEVENEIAATVNSDFASEELHRKFSKKNPEMPAMRTQNMSKHSGLTETVMLNDSESNIVNVDKARSLKAGTNQSFMGADGDNSDSTRFDSAMEHEDKYSSNGSEPGTADSDLPENGEFEYNDADFAEVDNVRSKNIVMLGKNTKADRDDSENSSGFAFVEDMNLSPRDTDNTGAEDASENGLQNENHECGDNDTVTSEYGYKSSETEKYDRRSVISPIRSASGNTTSDNSSDMRTDVSDFKTSGILDNVSVNTSSNASANTSSGTTANTSVNTSVNTSSGTSANTSSGTSANVSSPAVSANAPGRVTSVSSDASKSGNNAAASQGNVYRDSSGAVRFTDMSAEPKHEAEKPQPEYIFPPVELLKKGNAGKVSSQAKAEELEATKQKLQTAFESFGVGVKVTDASVGPTVTRYELLPDQGVKVKTITGLSDDIKLALAAAEIRIEAPIPGKAAVGIEVPNQETVPVFLGDLVDSEKFTKAKSKLSIAIGMDIGGDTIVSDIAGMPHALIAGATGSGKSVCINALIMSILYKAKPSEVKLIMIDPKRVELIGYNGIPHLLVPVVTDVKKASGVLNWALAEMDERYKRFADCGATNLASYNEIMEEDFVAEGGEGECPDKLPQIVIIVDELNDLMMTANSKDVENAIVRLTQLARACGIHVILATQRPSVNVITGTIKANIPTRMAFAVSSLVDSRTIIDQGGAEKLLGKGDMLFAPQGSPKPIRVQGAFVSDAEVKKVVEFIKSTCKEVKYNETVSRHIDENSDTGSAQNTGNDTQEKEGNDRDEKFEECGRAVISKGKASIGMFQRISAVGFNRAARIMDQLCDAGVVGPEEGTKPRKVLMTMEQFEAFLADPDAQNRE